jgi:hypothetical protein
MTFYFSAHFRQPTFFTMATPLTAISANTRQLYLLPCCHEKRPEGLGRSWDLPSFAMEMGFAQQILPLLMTFHKTVGVATENQTNFKLGKLLMIYGQIVK